MDISDMAADYSLYTRFLRENQEKLREKLTTRLLSGFI